MHGSIANCLGGELHGSGFVRVGILLVVLCAGDGQPEEAMRRLSQLEDDPGMDRAGVLLDRALIQALTLNDPDGARETVTRLQAVTLDRRLLKHARGMLEEALGPDVWLPLPEEPVAQEATSAPANDPVLDQNSPNPMNPRTVIHFSLPRTSRVALRVFDVHGRLVRTLLDENLAAGPQVVEWDGRDQTGTELHWALQGPSSRGTALCSVETRPADDTETSLGTKIRRSADIAVRYLCVGSRLLDHCF